MKDFDKILQQTDLIGKSLLLKLLIIMVSVFLYSKYQMHFMNCSGLHTLGWQSQSLIFKSQPNSRIKSQMYVRPSIVYVKAFSSILLAGTG